MIKWLHHLLNPHCPDCVVHCRSCEILERQLEIERQRSNLLLERVSLGGRAPVQIESESDEEGELKPIKTTRRKFMPFAVRQQMAEQNDLKTLEVLQTRWKEIHNPEKTEVLKSNEKLEKELLNTNVLANVSDNAAEEAS